jgi:hypothetical protein
MTNNNHYTIVKQYSAPNNFNLGLEKYNMSKFDGCKTMYEWPFRNGKPLIPVFKKDHKEIIENFYGCKIGEASFTDVVSNHVVTFSGQLTALDETNPQDLLSIYLLSLIKGSVAPTLEDADNPMNNHRHYIVSQKEEVATKVNKKVLVLEAASMLMDLKNNKSKHMVMVAKDIFANSGIGNNQDTAFIMLSDLIDGKNEQFKKDPIGVFMSAAKKDPKELRLSVDIKEAMVYNIIRRDSDGWYFNPASGVKYGKNFTEIYQYLKKPENQEELGVGNEKDATFSIRYQLSNK